MNPEDPTDGVDTDKAPPRPELCPSAHPQATLADKARLAGSLCSFEHPREPGEAELARLASRQHWCVHRRQILAAGIGRGGISGRRRRQGLISIFEDVYLYGRPDRASLSMVMATLLHLRGDAILGGESAAVLWALSDVVPEQVHVVLAGRNAHPMPGVVLHRVPAVHPADIRHRKGVPVTSPARSFLDFAGRVSLPRAESALAMLRRREHDADQQIRATLARLPANHRGVAVARRLLAVPPGKLSATRSVYERRLRRLLRAAGLAAPISNLMVAGWERDLAWPHAKLILEFDGWEFHRDRFEDDRRRDAAAVAAGWRVIRLTADRVDHEPFMVIAEIAAALISARVQAA